MFNTSVSTKRLLAPDFDLFFLKGAFLYYCIVLGKILIKKSRGTMKRQITPLNKLENPQEKNMEEAIYAKNYLLVDGSTLI